MSAQLAPVIVFAWNRPDHLRLVLESLSKNPEAASSVLYVFCDGPKADAGADEIRKITEVREVVKERRWCGTVHLVASETNKGLAASVIEGVNRIVSEYGRVIVLEDDLVCVPHFLQFMNRALEVYADDERVVSITGYIYPVKEELPETFFLRGADCWSWATWKRGWRSFEKDGAELLRQLEEKNLTQDFDFDGAYGYTKMLRDQVEGKNSSWAIRWYASAFLKNLLTLYPGSSLVQNIGIDGSGTHSTSSDKWNVTLSQRMPVIGNIPVEENSSARNSIVNFFRDLSHVPFGTRLLNRLSRLFSS